MDQHTMPTPLKVYEIRLATENDSEAILDHLRGFFFKTEPINKSIKLIEFEDSTCIELEDYCLETLHENNSLVAVTPSNKIIAVCLNGTLKKHSEEEKTECLNPKFSKILTLLDYAERNGTDAMSKRYPEGGRTISVRVVSTDTEWRNQGIARELMNTTRKNALAQGYEFMRVDCSSHFSARSIAKLGFECVYELKYEDYKENGIPVFKPAPPHNSLTVYVQKITAH